MRVTSDVTEGALILRVHGTSEAWVENYQSLLEYTDETICIKGKEVELMITGIGMRIEYYGFADMKILGSIQKVEYL